MQEGQESLAHLAMRVWLAVWEIHRKQLKCDSLRMLSYNQERDEGGLVCWTLSSGREWRLKLWAILYWNHSHGVLYSWRKRNTVFNNAQYTNCAQLSQFSVRNKSDFLGFVLRQGLSYSLGQPQTHYVAQDYLEALILLLLAFKYWLARLAEVNYV